MFFPLHCIPLEETDDPVRRNCRWLGEVGPGGFTPLHVAVSRDGSENVLDALTSSPEFVYSSLS